MRRLELEDEIAQFLSLAVGVFLPRTMFEQVDSGLAYAAVWTRIDIAEVPITNEQPFTLVAVMHLLFDEVRKFQLREDCSRYPNIADRVMIDGTATARPFFSNSLDYAHLDPTLDLVAGRT